MQKIDHLIYAKWLITCEEQNRILEDHCMAIQGDKILALFPSHEASKYSPTQTHHYDHHVLTPGFINCHTHVPMNLFRGLADDLPLMDWLQTYIWPAEKKWVDEVFVRDGALLAMAEMIRGGTTCFNDMYFYSEEIAKVADQVGMRAHLGMTVIDVPTRYADNADDYLARGLKLHAAYQNHPLIKLTFAPHSTYMVSLAHLEKIKELADTYQLKINIHCQEDAAEITLAAKQFNLRPLERLKQLNMLSPQLIAIHMTQLVASDFELLSEYQPHVVHCPESNMKLGNGVCQVEKLQSLGINVALGTDGAASNNDLDMIGEMHTAALLGKLASGDPTSLPAETILKMATINGAKALGIDQLTGSLEAGKSADFIAIDTSAIETQPLYQPLSQIVYACNREQVSDVWVAGRPIMQARQLKTIDASKLGNLAQRWQEKIKNLSA